MFFKQKAVSNREFRTGTGTGKGRIEKNNIEYELITKKSQSTLGMMFHANMAMEVGNGAFSHSQSVGPVSFVYIINVKKKEYEMALKAIKD